MRNDSFEEGRKRTRQSAHVRCREKERKRERTPFLSQRKRLNTKVWILWRVNSLEAFYLEARERERKFWKIQRAIWESKVSRAEDSEEEKKLAIEKKETWKNYPLEFLQREREREREKKTSRWTKGKTRKWPLIQKGLNGRDEKKRKTYSSVARKSIDPAWYCEVQKESITSRVVLCIYMYMCESVGKAWRWRI